MTMRRALPLSLALLIGGCGFFKAQQKEYFALDSVPPAAAPAAVSGSPIGIGSVELPPAIDRREIVVREEDQRLELRGRELWAGPLESMVVHTLAFDLADRLPEGMVVLPGQAKPAGAMRSIYVVIETMEAGPQNALVLDARWSVGATTPATARHERIEVPLASLDSGAIATGTSTALGILADRIVAGL
jgi:uncharacterized lipoprotein YmbA